MAVGYAINGRCFPTVLDAAKAACMDLPVSFTPSIAAISGGAGGGSSTARVWSCLEVQSTSAPYALLKVVNGLSNATVPTPITSAIAVHYFPVGFSSCDTDNFFGVGDATALGSAISALWIITAAVIWVRKGWR